MHDKISTFSTIIDPYKNAEKVQNATAFKPHGERLQEKLASLIGHSMICAELMSP